jgi:hypothetical protein
MTKRIKDIEDHLERSDARFERFMKIEAMEKQSERRERVIKICVGSAAIVCALYAVYLQF